MNENQQLISLSLNGDLETLKYLISKGANIESSTEEGFTPLHIASQEDHLDIIKYLVENGANIESKTNDRLTPLHIACLSGYIKIVKYLIENGASIESEEKSGFTSLHIACLYNEIEIVKYLIEKGANIESFSHRIDKLIDPSHYGDQINQKRKNRFHHGIRYTPLMISFQKNTKEISNYLIKHGANIHFSFLLLYQTIQ